MSDNNNNGSIEGNQPQNNGGITSSSSSPGIQHESHVSVDGARYNTNIMRRRHTTSNLPEEDSARHNQEGYDPTDAEQRPRTLEERHRAINTLFGIRPWKEHITRRNLSERSQVVKELYQAPKKPVSKSGNWITKISNIIYVFLVGWWLSLAYIFVGVLSAISIIGFPYAKLCFRLARYYFYPFALYLYRERIWDAEAGLLNGGDSETSKRWRPRFKSRTPLQWVSWTFWCIFLAPILFVNHLFASAICWFSVLYIPSAKVSYEGAKLLYNDSLSIRVDNSFPPAPGDEIVLCSYQALNFYYYKYTVGGMNVVLVNLLPFVGISIFLGYVTKLWDSEFPEKNASAIFVTCLFSIVPLAYYIGKAVSSISAQTSFALGAVLNATFGSIIELLIYFLALENDLHEVVQHAVTGSLLACMLLLPGLSMVAGGLKHKRQFFNKEAAGVSAVLLLLALVGAFTPTIFYQIFGNYKLDCKGCSGGDHLQCDKCSYVEKDYDDDPVYNHKAEPLMYICSFFLPLAYIIGLLFTLKTHSHIYEKDPAAEQPESVIEETQGAGGGGGHGEEIAEWSKLKCGIILLISTGLFAAVAEAMTDAMKPALRAMNIPNSFAGLTIIAVVPNTAEIVNAVQFALQDNISLSMEIGNVAAIQISLIQMPVLVLLSYVLFHSSATKSFTLIFPRIDMFALLLSVLILNYVSIDGRSNYFQGCVLLIVYSIFIAAFWFSF